ncbi:MAG: arginine--tRNA ligase, partial [Dehalococcoidales bacterium]
MALRHKIIGLLTEAAAKAQAAGKLPAVTLPDVALEHPQKPEHGDYASSLPLKLARATRLKPLDIAGVIRKFIPADPAIVSVAVAPPGFINFTLDSDWLSRQVEEVLASAETFGNVDLGKGRRVQIEFVSVNPTGPLHVGHGRGAILGSALANILSA